MKVLVVGCGASGRRHINNLTAIDRIKSISVFTGNKDCLNKVNHNDKVTITNSLTNTDADFAIIANDTYKHIDTAIPLAERGIHLFIEKPLSHNLNKTNELREIARKKKIKIFIGYNLRFLGAMKYVKEKIAQGVLGRLYFAKIEVGQYLPEWRQDRDYRDSYSSRKDAGGGVALDLSHEIDYMRYLFGDPVQWKVMKTKVSDLEIDSEDIFEGIYRYDNNFVCTVHMDYLQKEKARELRIVGSNGVLHCDFIRKKISIGKNDGEIVQKGGDMFDVSETYAGELNHFIEVIEKDLEPDIGLEDGIQVLRFLENVNV